MSIKQIRDDVRGFDGRFYATDEPEQSLGFDLYFIAKDCEAKTCECSVGECEPFLIAPSCEPHIAEPLARMLNAVPELLARVERLEAQARRLYDIGKSTFALRLMTPELAAEMDSIRAEIGKEE